MATFDPHEPRSWAGQAADRLASTFVCRTSGLSVGGGASTSSGKLIVAVILSLAEFELDLLRERVRSGSLTDIHAGRLPASFRSTRTPLWRSFDERATDEAESS
jgi:DNA invertase Pin-like site-specific DNA recombinase